jgi:mannan endo-1,6-alpha-mannosidase
VTDLLNATINTFFPDNIIYEIACEEKMTCTTDMLSFKGYVHRWMATVTQVAPFTKDIILPVLKTSTTAGISQCTGGANGRVCGFHWSEKTYDGTAGAGQQMNVLGAVSSLLIDAVRSPLTNLTGGTSKGDPNAGSQSSSLNGQLAPLTSGDRAGAGFLTFLILGAAVGTFGWMSTGV